MPDRHISSVYDAELGGLVAGLMACGGVCETQLQRAATSIVVADGELAQLILADEERLNRMELQLDRALGGVIARRQPIARDLRLLLAIGKALAHLERIGDEAIKVARLAPGTGAHDSELEAPLRSAMNAGVRLALQGLQGALDAFARHDLQAALGILRADGALDRWFEGFAVRLARQIDAHGIGAEQAIPLLLAAKAVERIGDHAKNVAEQVIYAASGEDVRHMPLDEVEALVS